MVDSDIEEAINKVRESGGVPELIWVFDQETLTKLKALVDQRGE